VVASFVVGTQQQDSTQYCASRGSAPCCIGRVDECTAPIRDGLCYCDEFCVVHESRDCCPDYYEVCGEYFSTTETGQDIESITAENDMNAEVPSTTESVVKAKAKGKKAKSTKKGKAGMVKLQNDQGCIDCENDELDWTEETCEAVFTIGLSAYEDYCDTLGDLAAVCGIREGDSTGTVFSSACHLMLANCKAEFHQGFLRRDGEKDIKIPRYAQSYEKSVEIAKDCPKLAAGNN